MITTRFHPAVLVGPAIAAVGGLILASVLSLAGASADAQAITWFTWLFVLLYALGRMLRWLVDFFVVTNQRMLLATGWLAHDVSMIPLVRVADLRFRRSFWGRVLGYGRFILQEPGEGGGIRTVNFLPYPEQLYLEVCGLLFPNREQED